MTRREVLKKGALFGGTLMWVAPVVQAVGMSPAMAQTASPGGMRCVEIYWTDSDGPNFTVCVRNCGEDFPTDTSGRVWVYEGTSRDISKRSGAFPGDGTLVFLDAVGVGVAPGAERCGDYAFEGESGKTYFHDAEGIADYGTQVLKDLNGFTQSVP